MGNWGGPCRVSGRVGMLFADMDTGKRKGTFEEVFSWYWEIDLELFYCACE